MTIVEQLAELRNSYPGCKAVVFADLSTGLVLASSASQKMTQETLDCLCQAGYRCLLGPEATLMAPFLAKGDQGPAEVGWHRGAEGLFCFVKAPEPACEALCLELSTGENVAEVSRAARALLARIMAED